jgi:hypothetical protein
MESERRAQHQAEYTLSQRIGSLLAVAGSLLVIAAFFTPWFDVYKLNDPSYPFPRRGYSPWTVVQSGPDESLGILAGIYALLVVGLAVSSVMLTLARTRRGRSRAWGAALAWALLNLTWMTLVVPAVPFDLSFSWPFLSSDIAYGVYLTAAGLLGAIAGLVVALTGRDQHR